MGWNDKSNGLYKLRELYYGCFFLFFLTKASNYNTSAIGNCEIIYFLKVDYTRSEQEWLATEEAMKTDLGTCDGGSMNQDEGVAVEDTWDPKSRDGGERQ